MFLSRHKNGMWYLFYHGEDGRRHKVSTHTTSKQVANEFLRQFSVPILRKASVSAILEQFLADNKLRYTDKTKEHFKVAVNEYLRIIGDNVDSATVRKFIQTKAEERSVWTARKYHIALRSMFGWAKRAGLISENPFGSVKQLQVRETMPAFLTREEFQRIVEYFHNDVNMQKIVIALTYTGMRVGELLRITKKDVHGDVLVVRGDISKGKRTRSIPIHSYVQAIINEFDGDGYMFSAYQLNTVEKKFKAAVRALGMDPRLRLHSLRHTFASWLVQKGVSLYKVAMLLGHRDVRTTQVYSHLSAPDVAKEVREL